MQTSAEVAEWGERWLCEWIAEPGIPDDERSTRAWLADGWRQWSLETWAFWLHGDRRMFGRPLDEFNANHAANNHALLYGRERNGLLIWRMFAEYRREGLPVPEAILRKFDEWAQRLEQASGTREIARAIEMTGPAGGPQGATHLRKVERQRALVSAVQTLVRLGLSEAEACRRVARERKISEPAIRSACTRWRGATKRRRGRGTVAETDALKVLRNLGR